MKQLKIAVSQCLLGDEVRYDGRSKPHPFLVSQSTHGVKFVPICPEVEIGLGVPQKPMALVYQDQSIRARQIEDPSQDYTQRLLDLAVQKESQMSDIAGYLFKARSPSCGVESTDVTGWNKKSSGIFAADIIRRYPQMPVADESVLDDGNLRDQFFENIYCYAAFNTTPAEFLKDYALRWILRTGNSINDLSHKKLPQLQVIYFDSLNPLIARTKRVLNLYRALKNNLQLFACCFGEASHLIHRYCVGDISFVHLEQEISHLLAEKSATNYRINISPNERMLRL